MTDDAAFVRMFEAGEIPEGAFHHPQHVRVAWWYLGQHSLPEAIARFSAALKQFAAARNKPDLYHETITVAYVLLINERRADAGAHETWDAFAERNPDLLRWRPSILEMYYTTDTLWSERARRTFVMPDRLARAAEVSAGSG